MVWLTALPFGQASPRSTVSLTDPTKAEEEAPKIQQEAKNAPSITEQAKQAKDQVQNATRSQQSQRPPLPPRA